MASGTCASFVVSRCNCTHEAASVQARARAHACATPGPLRIYSGVRDVGVVILNTNLSGLGREKKNGLCVLRKHTQTHAGQ